MSNYGGSLRNFIHMSQRERDVLAAKFKAELKEFRNRE